MINFVWLNDSVAALHCKPEKFIFGIYCSEKKNLNSNKSEPNGKHIQNLEKEIKIKDNSPCTKSKWRKLLMKFNFDRLLAMDKQQLKIL